MYKKDIQMAFEVITCFFTASLQQHITSKKYLKLYSEIGQANLDSMRLYLVEYWNVLNLGDFCHLAVFMT